MIEQVGGAFNNVGGMIEQVGGAFNNVGDRHSPSLKQG
jgi:hypothetical protein